jgi:hypothetical protein
MTSVKTREGIVEHPILAVERALSNYTITQAREFDMSKEVQSKRVANGKAKKRQNKRKLQRQKQEQKRKECLEKFVANSNNYQRPLEGHRILARVDSQTIVDGCNTNIPVLRNPQRIVNEAGVEATAGDLIKEECENKDVFSQEVQNVFDHHPGPNSLNQTTGQIALQEKLEYAPMFDDIIEEVEEIEKALDTETDDTIPSDFCTSADDSVFEDENKSQDVHPTEIPLDTYMFIDSRIVSTIKCEPDTPERAEALRAAAFYKSVVHKAYQHIDRTGLCYHQGAPIEEMDYFDKTIQKHIFAKGLLTEDGWVSIYRFVIGRLTAYLVNVRGQWTEEAIQKAIEESGLKEKERVEHEDELTPVEENDSSPDEEIPTPPELDTDYFSKLLPMSHLPGWRAGFMEVVNHFLDITPAMELRLIKHLEEARVYPSKEVRRQALADHFGIEDWTSDSEDEHIAFDYSLFPSLCNQFFEIEKVEYRMPDMLEFAPANVVDTFLMWEEYFHDAPENAEARSQAYYYQKFISSDSEEEKVVIEIPEYETIDEYFDRGYLTPDVFPKFSIQKWKDFVLELEANRIPVPFWIRDEIMRARVKAKLAKRTDHGFVPEFSSSEDEAKPVENRTEESDVSLPYIEEVVIHLTTDESLASSDDEVRPKAPVTGKQRRAMRMGGNKHAEKMIAEQKKFQELQARMQEDHIDIDDGDVFRDIEPMGHDISDMSAEEVIEEAPEVEMPSKEQIEEAVEAEMKFETQIITEITNPIVDRSAYSVEKPIELFSELMVGCEHDSREDAVRRQKALASAYTYMDTVMEAVGFIDDVGFEVGDNAPIKEIDYFDEVNQEHIQAKRISTAYGWMELVDYVTEVLEPFLSEEALQVALRASGFPGVDSKIIEEPKECGLNIEYETSAAEDEVTKKPSVKKLTKRLPKVRPSSDPESDVEMDNKVIECIKKINRTCKRINAEREIFARKGVYLRVANGSDQMETIGFPTTKNQFEDLPSSDDPAFEGYMDLNEYLRARPDNHKRQNQCRSRGKRNDHFKEETLSNFRELVCCTILFVSMILIALVLSFLTISLVIHRGGGRHNQSFIYRTSTIQDLNLSDHLAASEGIVDDPMFINLSMGNSKWTRYNIANSLVCQHQASLNIVEGNETTMIWESCHPDNRVMLTYIGLSLVCGTIMLAHICYRLAVWAIRVVGYENKRRSRKISHERSLSLSEIGELKVGQGPKVRDTPEGLRKNIESLNLVKETQQDEGKDKAKNTIPRFSIEFLCLMLHVFLVVVFITVSLIITQSVGPPVEMTTQIIIGSYEPPPVIQFISGELPSEVKTVLDNITRNIIALGILITTAAIVSCCFTCKFEFFKCIRIFLAILLMFGVFLVCVKLVSVDYNMSGASTQEEKETGVPPVSTSGDPQFIVDTKEIYKFVRMVLASLSGLTGMEVPNDLGDEEIPPEQTEHLPISGTLQPEHSYIGDSPLEEAKKLEEYGMTKPTEEVKVTVSYTNSGRISQTRTENIVSVFNLSNIVHHDSDKNENIYDYSSLTMIAGIKFTGQELSELIEMDPNKHLVREEDHDFFQCNNESEFIFGLYQGQSKQYDYDYACAIVCDGEEEFRICHEYCSFFMGSLYQNEKFCQETVCGEKLSSMNWYPTFWCLKIKALTGRYFNGNNDSSVKQTTHTDVVNRKQKCKDIIRDGHCTKVNKKFCVPRYCRQEIKNISPKLKNCTGNSDYKPTGCVGADLNSILRSLKDYQYTVGLKRSGPKKQVNNNRRQQPRRRGSSSNRRDRGNTPVVADVVIEEPLTEGEHAELQWRDVAEQTYNLNVAAPSAGRCMNRFLVACQRYHPLCCQGRGRLHLCLEPSDVIPGVVQLYNEYDKCLIEVSKVEQKADTIAQVESEIAKTKVIEESEENKMEVYQTTHGDVAFMDDVWSAWDTVKETAGKVKSTVETVVEDVKDAYETTTLDKLGLAFGRELDTLKTEQIVKVFFGNDIMEPERFEFLVNRGITKSDNAAWDVSPLFAHDLPTSIESSYLLAKYWTIRHFTEPNDRIQMNFSVCNNDIQLSHIKPCQAKAYAALPGDKIYSHGAYTPLFMEIGVTTELVKAFETPPASNWETRETMVHHTATGNINRPSEFVTTAGNLKLYIETMIKECYKLPVSQDKQWHTTKFQIKHTIMYLNYTEMCLAYSSGLYYYLEQAYQTRNYQRTGYVYSNFGLLNLDNFITKHTAFMQDHIFQKIIYHNEPSKRIGPQPTRMVSLVDYVKPTKYEVTYADEEHYLVPDMYDRFWEGADWSLIIPTGQETVIEKHHTEEPNNNGSHFETCLGEREAAFFVKFYDNNESFPVHATAQYDTLYNLYLNKTREGSVKFKEHVFNNTCKVSKRGRLSRAYSAFRYFRHFMGVGRDLECLATYGLATNEHNLSDDMEELDIGISPATSHCESTASVDLRLFGKIIGLYTWIGSHEGARGKFSSKEKGRSVYDLLHEKTFQRYGPYKRTFASNRDEERFLNTYRMTKFQQFYRLVNISIRYSVVANCMSKEYDCQYYMLSTTAVDCFNKINTTQEMIMKQHLVECTKGIQGAYESVLSTLASRCEFWFVGNKVETISIQNCNIKRNVEIAYKRHEHLISLSWHRTRSNGVYEQEIEVYERELRFEKYYQIRQTRMVREAKKIMLNHSVENVTVNQTLRQTQHSDCQLTALQVHRNVIEHCYRREDQVCSLDMNVLAGIPHIVPFPPHVHVTMKQLSRLHSMSKTYYRHYQTPLISCNSTKDQQVSRFDSFLTFIKENEVIDLNQVDGKLISPNLPTTAAIDDYTMPAYESEYGKIGMCINDRSQCTCTLVECPWMLNYTTCVVTSNHCPLFPKFVLFDRGAYSEYTSWPTKACFRNEFTYCAIEANLTVSTKMVPFDSGTKLTLGSLIGKFEIKAHVEVAAGEVKGLFIDLNAVPGNSGSPLYCGNDICGILEKGGTGATGIILYQGRQGRVIENGKTCESEVYINIRIFYVRQTLVVVKSFDETVESVVSSTTCVEFTTSVKGYLKKPSAVICNKQVRGINYCSWIETLDRDFIRTLPTPYKEFYSGKIPLDRLGSLANLPFIEYNNHHLEDTVVIPYSSNLVQHTYDPKKNIISEGETCIGSVENAQYLKFREIKYKYRYELDFYSEDREYAVGSCVTSRASKTMVSNNGLSKVFNLLSRHTVADSNSATASLDIIPTSYFNITNVQGTTYLYSEFEINSTKTIIVDSNFTDIPENDPVKACTIGSDYRCETVVNKLCNTWTKDKKHCKQVSMKAVRTIVIAQRLAYKISGGDLLSLITFVLMMICHGLTRKQWYGGYVSLLLIFLLILNAYFYLYTLACLLTTIAVLMAIYLYDNCKNRGQRGHLVISVTSSEIFNDVFMIAVMTYYSLNVPLVCLAVVMALISVWSKKTVDKDQENKTWIANRDLKLAFINHMPASRILALILILAWVSIIYECINGILFPKVEAAIPEPIQQLLEFSSNYLAAVFLVVIFTAGIIVFAMLDKLFFYVKRRNLEAICIRKGLDSDRKRKLLSHYDSWATSRGSTAAYTLCLDELGNSDQVKKLDIVSLLIEDIWDLLFCPILIIVKAVLYFLMNITMTVKDDEVRMSIFGHLFALSRSQHIRFALLGCSILFLMTTNMSSVHEFVNNPMKYYKATYTDWITWYIQSQITLFVTALYVIARAYTLPVVMAKHFVDMEHPIGYVIAATCAFAQIALTWFYYIVLIKLRMGKCVLKGYKINDKNLVVLKLYDPVTMDTGEFTLNFEVSSLKPARERLETSETVHVLNKNVYITEFTYLLGFIVVAVTFNAISIFAANAITEAPLSSSELRELNLSDVGILNEFFSFIIGSCYDGSKMLGGIRNKIEEFHKCVKGSLSGEISSKLTSGLLSNFKLGVENRSSCVFKGNNVRDYYNSNRNNENCLASLEGQVLAHLRSNLPEIEVTFDGSTFKINGVMYKDREQISYDNIRRMREHIKRYFTTSEAISFVIYASLVMIILMILATYSVYRYYGAKVFKHAYLQELHDSLEAIRGYKQLQTAKPVSPMNVMDMKDSVWPEGSLMIMKNGVTINGAILLSTCKPRTRFFVITTKHTLRIWNGPFDIVSKKGKIVLKDDRFKCVDFDMDVVFAEITSSERGLLDVAPSKPLETNAIELDEVITIYGYDSDANRYFFSSGNVHIPSSSAYALRYVASSARGTSGCAVMFGKKVAAMHTTGYPGQTYNEGINIGAIMACIEHFDERPFKVKITAMESSLPTKGRREGYWYGGKYYLTDSDLRDDSHLSRTISEAISKKMFIIPRTDINIDAFDKYSHQDLNREELTPQEVQALDKIINHAKVDSGQKIEVKFHTKYTPYDVDDLVDSLKDLAQGETIERGQIGDVKKISISSTAILPRRRIKCHMSEEEKGFENPKHDLGQVVSPTTVRDMLREFVRGFSKNFFIDDYCSGLNYLTKDLNDIERFKGAQGYELDKDLQRQNLPPNVKVDYGVNVHDMIDKRYIKPEHFKHHQSDNNNVCFCNPPWDNSTELETVRLTEALLNSYSHGAIILPFSLRKYLPSLLSTRTGKVFISNGHQAYITRNASHHQHDVSALQIIVIMWTTDPDYKLKSVLADHEDFYIVDTKEEDIRFEKKALESRIKDTLYKENDDKPLVEAVMEQVRNNLEQLKGVVDTHNLNIISETFESLHEELYKVQRCEVQDCDCKAVRNRTRCMNHQFIVNCFSCGGQTYSASNNQVRCPFCISAMANKPPLKQITITLGDKCRDIMTDQDNIQCRCGMLRHHADWCIGCQYGITVGQCLNCDRMTDFIGMYPTCSDCVMCERVGCANTSCMTRDIDGGQSRLCIDHHSELSIEEQNNYQCMVCVRSLNECLCKLRPFIINREFHVGDYDSMVNYFAIHPRYRMNRATLTYTPGWRSSRPQQPALPSASPVKETRAMGIASQRNMTPRGGNLSKRVERIVDTASKNTRGVRFGTRGASATPSK